MGFIGTHQIVTCSSSFQRTARLGKPLPFPVPNARHPQRSTGFNGTSRDLVGINHIEPYVYTYLTMFLPHMPIFNQHSGHSVKENTHHISNDSHLWTSHTEFHRDPSASKALWLSRVQRVPILKRCVWGRDSWLMTHIQWRQADTSLLGHVGSCKTWVLRSPVLLKFDLAILAFKIIQSPFKSSSPTWLNDPSLPSSWVLQSHKPHRAQQHCMMRSIATPTCWALLPDKRTPAAGRGMGCAKSLPRPTGSTGEGSTNNIRTAIGRIQDQMIENDWEWRYSVGIFVIAFPQGSCRLSYWGQCSHTWLCRERVPLHLMIFNHHFP